MSLKFIMWWGAIASGVCSAICLFAASMVHGTAPTIVKSKEFMATFGFGLAGLCLAFCFMNTLKDQETFFGVSARKIQLVFLLCVCLGAVSYSLYVIASVPYPKTKLKALIPLLLGCTGVVRCLMALTAKNETSRLL